MGDRKKNTFVGAMLPRFTPMVNILACATLLFLSIGCSEMTAGADGTDWSYDGSGSSATTGEETDDDTAQDDQAEESQPATFFYFSYDDSASTAAAELIKYRLTNNEIPDPALGRPWELLSYERFTPPATETVGIFAVSMGLGQRLQDSAFQSEEDAAEGIQPYEYRLGVSVSSPTISARDPAVLTLIVDISGSMESYAVTTDEVSFTRLEVVRHALAKLADLSLIDGDILNLVTFDQESYVVFENLAYPADAQEISAAFADIDSGGSTNLNAGITQGYELATEYYDSSRTNRVVILTDAYANTGEIDAEVISGNTRINNMEGIYFSGLGIGADFNEAFLNELTEAGKGAYFSVLTKSDAERAFSDNFIALLQVAAKDVMFRLDFPEALTHDATAGEESSTDESDVQSTNFSYNTDQYFFEGFTGGAEPLPADAAFSLTVSYTDVESDTDGEYTLTMTAADLLTRDADLLADAEAVFLLGEAVADRIEPQTAQAMLSTYYPDYSSAIFDEYSGYIDTLVTLEGTGDDDTEDTTR